MFLSWFLPKPLWRFGEPFIYAIMDDRLLAAVGFATPASWIRRFAEGALKLRARLLRFSPARRRPRLLTQQKYPTYPNGYRIEQLGPQEAGK
jgi:hypothetical protein